MGPGATHEITQLSHPGRSRLRRMITAIQARVACASRYGFFLTTAIEDTGALRAMQFVRLL